MNGYLACEAASLISSKLVATPSTSKVPVASHSCILSAPPKSAGATPGKSNACITYIIRVVVGCG